MGRTKLYSHSNFTLTGITRPISSHGRIRDIRQQIAEAIEDDQVQILRNQIRMPTVNPVIPIQQQQANPLQDLFNSTIEQIQNDENEPQLNGAHNRSFGIVQLRHDVSPPEYSINEWVSFPPVETDSHLGDEDTNPDFAEDNAIAEQMFRESITGDINGWEESLWF